VLLRAEEERSKPSLDRDQRAPRVKFTITLAQHIAGAEVAVMIRRHSFTVVVSPRAPVGEAIFIEPQTGLALGAYAEFTIEQSGRDGLSLMRVNLSAKALVEQGFSSAEEKLERYWQVREALETLRAVKADEDGQRLHAPHCLVRTQGREIESLLSKLETLMAKGSEESGDVLVTYELSAEEAVGGFSGLVDLSVLAPGLPDALPLQAADGVRGGVSILCAVHFD
jgi:hypothetical protein